MINALILGLCLALAPQQAESRAEFPVSESLRLAIDQKLETIATMTVRPEWRERVTAAVRRHLSFRSTTFRHLGRIDGPVLRNGHVGSVYYPQYSAFESIWCDRSWLTAESYSEEDLLTAEEAERAMKQVSQYLTPYPWEIRVTPRTVDPQTVDGRYASSFYYLPEYKGYPSNLHSGSYISIDRLTGSAFHMFLQHPGLPNLNPADVPEVTQEQIGMMREEALAAYARHKPLPRARVYGPKRVLNGPRLWPIPL